MCIIGVLCASGHLDFQLLRALEGIKDQLQSLSECSSAAGYQENDKDIQAVCGLAGEVRDAVVEYQVSPNPPIISRMAG